MQKVGTIIECPYFKKQDDIIIRLTEAVKKSELPDEKRSVVHEYLEELEVLLNCSEFSDTDKNCRVCKMVMTARKESGKLILKGLELSNPGG